MNDIRAWSAMVCMAALGCSAVRLLAPKTGSGKLFSLITASFFLCALSLPLLNVVRIPELDIDRLPPDTVEGLLEDKVTEQVSLQVEEAVRQVVDEAMAVRGIAAQKVEIHMDTSDTGGIYIERVTIYVDKQSVPIAAVVREVLAAQLETTVELKTEA